MELHGRLHSRIMRRSSAQLWRSSRNTVYSASMGHHTAGGYLRTPPLHRSVLFVVRCSVLLLYSLCRVLLYSYRVLLRRYGVLGMYEYGARSTFAYCLLLPAEVHNFGIIRNSLLKNARTSLSSRRWFPRDPPLLLSSLLDIQPSIIYRHFPLSNFHPRGDKICTGQISSIVARSFCRSARLHESLETRPPSGFRDPLCFPGSLVFGKL